MDWKTLFKSQNGNNLSFFDPITEQELSDIKHNTGIEISGDLLELLKQTNGIMENIIVDKKCINSGFIVFNSDEIIKTYKIHLSFLKEAELIPPHQFLFFSDNGCGEGFCFITENGKIISKEISIYYPIENKFFIVAPDLMTWITDWYSGKIYA